MKIDIKAYCDTVAKNFTDLINLQNEINEAASFLKSTLANGNKLLLCGNGGSASDAQHIAAELVGRYKVERDSLPAIALSTNISTLTAIANDYSFEEIFSRQVKGLGKKGDLLIAISTSGNSENVIRAVEAANEKGITTIGLTGRSGGKMKSKVSLAISVPSDATNHIQEMHIAIGHMICGIIES